jgi:hypothetical protein
MVTPKSGKAIAWLSFTLGIAVSIAGNIGHAASDGMKPGEWAGAAFWPLALMLTIEILTRVRWQPGKRWTAARIAGLVLVAAVAAVLSYRHLAGLMTYWGEDKLNAHLGPLAVDGLMLVAATALLSISHERVPEPVETTGKPELPPVAPESTVDAELTKLIEKIRDEPAELPPADKPKPRPKVQTSISVPASAAEEAAFQAWMNAPANNKPSVRKLAELSGMSPATVGRRLIKWKKLESVSS